MYGVNYLPKRDMKESLTGCCPPFDPAEWDGQTFTFDQKLFLKFTTRSVFHIPLNINSMMRKIMQQIEKAGATSPDNLMLSDEVSPWKADHYVAVAKDMPGAMTVRLDGIYLAKVFEGPFRNMDNWHTELIAYARSKGKDPVTTYFNYTMCPRCAKAYGHNYVVGFVKVN